MSKKRVKRRKTKKNSARIYTVSEMDALALDVRNLLRGSEDSFHNIAVDTGLSPQTLYNLYHCQVQCPRIRTLRVLGEYFGLQLVFRAKGSNQ